MNCDVDIRTDLYANVVVSGGTAMFLGIGYRITRPSLPPRKDQGCGKLWPPPEHKHSVWIGGSILSSLST